MASLSDVSITLLASIAMVVAYFLAFLPMIPGPIFLWGIALVYGWATGFEILTPLALVALTLITLAASLSDFWLPLLGIKTEGGNCRAAFGTMIGGIIGTFVIPIPILGTLIGSMVGAAGLEYLYRRQLREAGGAARFAFKNFVYSFVVEIIANTIIVFVFFAVVFF